jgi:hypothetical protein
MADQPRVPRSLGAEHAPQSSRHSRLDLSKPFIFFNRWLSFSLFPRSFALGYASRRLAPLGCLSSLVF